MPKYSKKQLDKVITYVNSSAEATMTFSTAKFSTYFGNGGTSFVLEDAEGTKVRFIYTSVHHNSSPAMGGYFEVENDLQPRFLNGDINSPTTLFQVGKEFFGYGWNQETDSIIQYYELGAAVKIFYGDISARLTSSDSDEVLEGVTELVIRTVNAINYAEEIKITASVTNNNTINLEQDLIGTSGNTNFFRGYAEGLNNEGSAYGILTSDISTTNFSGGEDQATGPVTFLPRSGVLSKATKKILRDRNNRPSSSPHNSVTTGKKLNVVSSTFNDLSTQIFLNNQIDVDPRLQVKLKELDVVDGNPSDFFIFTLQDVSNIATSQQVKDLNLEHLLLSKTESFEKSNVLNRNSVTKNILSNNYAIIQKNIYEEPQTSFIDSPVIKSDSSLAEFNNSSLFEEETVYTQKEISFELDFLSQDGSKDAILINTDFYKSIGSEMSSIVVPKQFNFINAGKISSINSLQTAYWNDIEKEWNYLDFNEFNTTENKVPFIFPDNVVELDSNEISEIDASLDLMSHKSIAFGPSYRPVVYNNSNTNINDNTLSQVTSTYGFPSKYNWQPHKNHTVKMSDYITDNFYVEKVIIKGKCSIDAEKVSLNGNLKSTISNIEFTSLSNFNEELPGRNESFLNSNYISTALNFFILVEKNQKAITDFPKLVSYFEGKNISGLNASDSKIETKSQYEGILGLVDRNGYDNFIDGAEVFQRVIDNTVTNYNNFYNEQNLFVENNNINEDLNNKFFNITPVAHDSGNINVSLHNLGGSFDQSNINATLDSSDSSIFTNASHFELNEKFISDKVYLNTNKKRELLTYANLLFVNSSDDIFDNQSFLENTKEMSVITDNTSNNFINIENREFTLYSKIKNCFGDNYLDKSIYTTRRINGTDDSIFNILEGRPEDVSDDRTLKSKNISNNKNLKVFRDENEINFDANNNIYNEKLVASILKPSDTIVFGVNSYSNGNLIGSVAKLHDKLTITLIGKEVNRPLYKNNISDAIHRTIVQSNNINYNQINKPKLEQDYSLTNGTKQKFSAIKRKRYIKDTVWPNISSIFNFFNKEFIVKSDHLAKYKQGHFENTLDYILSEDVFTDEEKASDSYLSNVLTYNEWKNFNIFNDEINETTLVRNWRAIDVLDTNYNYNSHVFAANAYKATAFLKYDKNGYDGNTIKNYVSSLMYSNLEHRFVVNYTNFQDHVNNNDYSDLSDSVNQNNTNNVKVFGKPLDFNTLSANNQNILESNYNITKNSNEVNFDGIFTLQKPQVYNRWCLVPLIEDNYDYSSPTTVMSTVYNFLKDLATFCFNNNKEKYFNFTGRVNSNLDDDFLNKGFSTKALQYLSYEFKIKIPVRVGSVFKNLTTLIFTRSDDQESTHFISDVNVVIPLEYYETGEFGYNFNIDNRQTNFSSSTILELDPQNFSTLIYDGNTINNFSLFNILHGRYRDVNIDTSTSIFNNSFMPDYVNHSQSSHKFYHNFSDFVENLDNSYTTYNFKQRVWTDPAELTFNNFVENYLTFEYNSLNIDILFNRVKPDALLNGSPADYLINMSSISNINKNIEFSEDLSFYKNPYDKKIEDIKHQYISEEIVPNIGLSLINLFANPAGYSVSNINKDLEQVINNLDIDINDTADVKRTKQFLNFYINRDNVSNYQNSLLENYEKIYTYKDNNVKSVFKRKDNYYNLNFEDTPNNDNAVYSGKNRVIDMKCFTNSYYTTNRDIPGVYDVIIDYDDVFNTLEYKIKDPIKESINANNDTNLEVNEFSVKFDDINYDYKTIRQNDGITFKDLTNCLPILNLQNSPKAYFNDLDVDKKSKCIMYGVSRKKEFAIRKVDKFKFGVMTPYNHEKRYYLSKLNNNNVLNKLSGTKNYAFLDTKSNESSYPVIKLFINEFFVYYDDTTIQNANLASYNTDKHAKQTLGFVDD